MTDKPTQSLNLIERMAQRMAKQENASPRPQTVEPDAPAAGPRSEAAQQANGQGVVRSAQPSSAGLSPRLEPTLQPKSPQAPILSVPASAPARTATSRSREVRLDFRELRQNGMITPDNMASAISNEFRGIKRKLLQRARDPNTRAAVNNLIMVTSSLPGEGKTFTATNLAISLAAERGLQVLLIDADVIRPSVGNIFLDAPRDGLLDLLNGKASQVSDVMCRCADIPNLAVIFAGGANVHSPELISSARMSDFCTDISTRYPDRMIVIDTPPVLASTEPATLASYVHQLIMVVAADQTDRHQLRKSLDAVASCKNISLLFNKAPRWNEAAYTPYYGYTQNVGAPSAASS